jgi:chondroitin AC lyase
MKQLFILILFPLLLHSSAKANADTLLNRYNDFLFRTSMPAAQNAQHWAETLNQNGQWPDVNYADKELAGWKISLHLVRLRDMALIWANPKSTNYHDQLIWKKINLALDHWSAKRYQSTNWWHNEIGVPRLMRDIIILLRPDLSQDRLKKALAVMSQLRVRDDYLGGNLIWCADLGLHYGALTGDEKLMERCRQLIVKEIKVGTGEGIQPDYSFHQHGKRLQQYQYGKAFVVESVRMAWQLRGTSMALPSETINILTDFILDGWQWMARGINTVPGTMDRSASRKGELKSPDLRSLIPLMIELQPAKKATLMQMEAIQHGKRALLGYRDFPYSDFMAYHRPGFSFFLKTISDRTLPTEAINNENLKGKLLNSGDGYLIKNGQEYFNLMPVWNWTALPGVTAFKNATQIERKTFVGSVTDRKDGFTAMDYMLKDKTGKQVLSARKFWACHQDVVVSLIADIKVENIADQLYTALDQCRWQGDVTVNEVNNVLDSGSNKIDQVNWIHHAGFAYIPLKPTSFEIRLNEISGSWTTINGSETKEPVRERVFAPVMLHNPSADHTSGYALALSKSAKHTQQLANKPTWRVIQNDKDCQAVTFKDGVIMAAFYSSTKLEMEKIRLEVDQPCLILLKKGHLYASDPSHQGVRATIKFNDQVFSVALPKDGSTKLIKE